MGKSCREGFPALVAFDLDDTLAPSKSALSPEMCRALALLLEVRPVCIISGGRFSQLEEQVLRRLPASAQVDQLHIMPTCGTRYMRFRDGGWTQLYAHDLSQAERDTAIAALENRARQLGLWEPDDIVRGGRIEDRGSQITFSALGQQATVAVKKAWDPSGDKRERLRAAVAADLPDLEVRAGGSTSIDITRRGIDKAHGMKELATHTGISLDDMLFVGDRLEPGGNDYPVRALGVACHAVTGPDETLEFLARLTPALHSGSEPALDLLPA
ncbi:HAD-IIB family hydrolase [Propionibacterium sp.]|uniref:HAD-IIB family hydrolase n=1 Tax=Propionibacterium sp. TaxID=1977903 RepID=UPI0039ECB1EB